MFGLLRAETHVRWPFCDISVVVEKSVSVSEISVSVSEISSVVAVSVAHFPSGVVENCIMCRRHINLSDFSHLKPILIVSYTKSLLFGYLLKISTVVLVVLRICQPNFVVLKVPILSQKMLATFANKQSSVYLFVCVDFVSLY